MDLKRKAENSALMMLPTKKQRPDLMSSTVGSALQAMGIKRTSMLQAPIMLLTGHEGEIFSTKFSPNGRLLASAGTDKKILLWEVYGSCNNTATLQGHHNAVMDVQFSTDGSNLVTCSTDKTMALWDVETAERLRRFKGHTAYVNSCGVARRGPQMLCTGADDNTVKIWDSRRKIAVQNLDTQYQTLAATFNDNTDQVISAGIDNDIKVWDLRKGEVAYCMRGHMDSITGLCLSPDGSYVLSTAMDNTVRIWDVRPYAPKERCVKIFQGNQHIFEKNLLRVSWSSDGSKVSAGSGDRMVYVWCTTSRRILYRFPGHGASVNEVAFHPNEPIIASASSDKQIFLGEIE